MTEPEFEDDLGEVDLNFTPKPLEELQADLPTFSQEKLCEIIVINRCFGSKKELAIMCMEELAKRRIAGEVFDFEGYIEKSYSEMPKLEIAVPDITNVLRQFVTKKAGR